MAREVSRVFLSKGASEDLGIISKSFPTIGAFAMGLSDKEGSQSGTEYNDKDCEIKDFKGCVISNEGICNCPGCELPPEAPPRCVPFLQLQTILIGLRIGLVITTGQVLSIPAIVSLYL